MITSYWSAAEVDQNILYGCLCMNVGLSLCNNCGEYKGLWGKEFISYVGQSLPARLSVFNRVRQNELITRSSVGLWQCQLSIATAAMIWQWCQTMMGKTEWLSSQQLLWFSAVFGLWVRFNCIPYFRKSCRESPKCQDKSKLSVVTVDGFGLDMRQLKWVCASHAGR